LVKKSRMRHSTATNFLDGSFWEEFRREPADKPDSQQENREPQAILTLL